MSRPLGRRLARAWAELTGAPRAAPNRVRAIFTGVMGGRLNADWSPSILPGDEEVRISALELRKRGRDLVKNNAYVARHVELRRDNLVGARGPKLQAMVRDASGDLDVDRNDAIEAAWERYFRGAVTIDGRMNGAEFLKLQVESRISDGESFIRKWRGFARNPFGLGLEQIDADQVDEKFHQFLAPGRPEIRSGIEYGAFGEPTGYHVWEGPYVNAHVYRERKRIDARDIIHYFRQKRAGVGRGYTPLAPVMQALRHFDGFEDAAVMHARAAACQMAAIVKKGGDDEFGDGSGTGEPPMDESGGVPASAPPIAPRTMEAIPAVLQELEVGETLQSFTPNHPNANHADFGRTIGRKLASGLSESYIALMSDPEAANFSAARFDQLIARSIWESEQEELFWQVLDDWYREWLNSALLTDQLKLGTIEADQVIAHEWRGRRWGQVQPVEEREAQILGISAGLASRTQFITEGGREPWDVFTELEEERQAAEEKGIDITARPTVASSKPDDKKPDDEEKKPNAKPNGNGKTNGKASERGGRMAALLSRGHQGRR